MSGSAPVATQVEIAAAASMVGGAAEATKEVARVLCDVAGAASEAQTSAQTVLEASEAVASIAANLRGEVESFLGKVAV